MTRYLLSVYQPDGPVPEPEVLDKVMADLEVLNAEMRAAGAWVFAGGLHPASTATARPCCSRKTRPISGAVTAGTPALSPRGRPGRAGPRSAG